MRNTLLIIISLMFTIDTIAQEAQLSASYALASSPKFRNSLGTELEYNHFIKQHRITASGSLYFCNASYRINRYSLVDGTSRDIADFEELNSRIALRLYHSFPLIRRPKSNFYIGYFASLNYYLISGRSNWISSGSTRLGVHEYNYKKNNKLGCGPIIEYEIKEIITKNTAIFIQAQSELTLFSRFTLGTYFTPIIGWVNCKFGIKYNFTG